MTYETINAYDIADALQVPLSEVIGAIVALVSDDRTRALVGSWGPSYSVAELAITWRGVLKVRNHLQRGQSPERSRELDEFAVELVKLHHPDAPVEVRAPCRGCANRKPSDILGIRKYS